MLLLLLLLLLLHNFPASVHQVACGPCNSYSAHLYEVLGAELGPEDGMTMKNSFCEELVAACEGQIDFPTYDGESYCEKHTLGSSSDAYWSYPLDPEGKPEHDPSALASSASSPLAQGGRPVHYTV